MKQIADDVLVGLIEVSHAIKDVQVKLAEKHIAEPLIVGTHEQQFGPAMAVNHQATAMRLQDLISRSELPHCQLEIYGNQVIVQVGDHQEQIDLAPVHNPIEPEVLQFFIAEEVISHILALEDAA